MAPPETSLTLVLSIGPSLSSITICSMSSGFGHLYILIYLALASMPRCSWWVLVYSAFIDSASIIHKYIVLIRARSSGSSNGASMRATSLSIMPDSLSCRSQASLYAAYDGLFSKCTSIAGYAALVCELLSQLAPASDLHTSKHRGRGADGPADLPGSHSLESLESLVIYIQLAN